MGIFSQNNKLGLGAMTVEAAAGYGGVDAGAKIKLENYQNDMALFTAIIESDFRSTKAQHEGAVSEATVITEGTAANLFNKIKELFKKLWEKLKGMIQSFMVKFVAVFVKDNKKLVDKYHKQIMKQFAASDKRYSEMEFKMTEGYYKWLTGDKSVEKLDIKGLADVIQNTAANKVIKDNSNEDIKEQVNKAVIAEVVKSFGINNIDSLSELKKELDETYVGDKEDYTGYTESLNRTIEDELTKSAKTISAAKSEKSKVDQTCKKLVETAENGKKKAEKDLTDNTEVNKAIMDTANIFYYGAQDVQSALTTAVSWKLNFLKAAIKEARALYVKAVSRRAVKEDTDLLDEFIDEAVTYDVDMMFEGEVEADLNNDDLSAELDDIDQIDADDK